MRKLLQFTVVGLLMAACGVAPDPSGGTTYYGSHVASSSGSGGIPDHGGDGANGGSNGGGSSGGGSSSGGSNGGGASAPQTVEDLVALANSLPKPLTIADFIAALPHPLALNATSSRFSLQPAVDADDPRIFIAIGHLVLSVVPTGPNANTLEIGDMSNGQMSPAQLSFPVSSPISAAAPYQAVLGTTGGGGGGGGFGGGGFGATATVCGKCHQKTGAEVELTQVSGTPVYGMGPILPFPQFNVPVTTLISLAQSCTPSSDPERCDIFNALTTPTAPTQYDF